MADSFLLFFASSQIYHQILTIKLAGIIYFIGGNKAYCFQAGLCYNASIEATFDDVQEILSKVITRTNRNFEPSRLVALIEPSERNCVRARWVAGADALRGLILPMVKVWWLGCYHAKPALIPDVHQDDRFYKTCERSGFQTQSIMCVPLRAMVTAGVIELMNMNRDYLSDNGLKFSWLTPVTPLVAIEIPVSWPKPVSVPRSRPLLFESMAIVTSDLALENSSGCREPADGRSAKSRPLYYLTVGKG